MVFLDLVHMALDTGKKYISLVFSCYLPVVATEWHFVCLVSHLDLCRFYLQPLKFILFPFD